MLQRLDMHRLRVWVKQNKAAIAFVLLMVAVVSIYVVMFYVGFTPGYLIMVLTLFCLVFCLSLWSSKVREALITYGFAEIETNPRERAVYVRLTEKGRKLAECLESLGIEVG